jgi:carboxylesterase
LNRARLDQPEIPGPRQFSRTPRASSPAERKARVSSPLLHNPTLEGGPFSWGSGTTGVLLFHGFTATTADVRPLAKLFREAGLTVSGPLLPGHATSPDDLNQVSWREWMAEAERSYALLQGRCERVFVGGESMGAVIALGLAARHPEIAGVLCYAPAIKLALTAPATLKLRLASAFVPQIARESLDCSDTWQGYPGLPLKGAVQLLRLQKAVLRGLADIRQPVLVIQGRRDTTIDPRAGEIIFAAIRSDDRRHHWMERSSHAVTLDHDLDEVARISLDFIASATQP